MDLGLVHVDDVDVVAREKARDRLQRLRPINTFNNYSKNANVIVLF